MSNRKRNHGDVQGTEGSRELVVSAVNSGPDSQVLNKKLIDEWTKVGRDRSRR